MYIRIIKMLLFFIFISLSIESHANWIGKMIEAIPGKPAEGVADYLEIVGLNPERAKNTDIRSYNTQLVENNPCMRSLATQFYVSLTAEGVSEVIAEQITSSAINAYRATTLCTEMKFQQQTLDFKTSPAEGFSLVQEIRKNKSDCQTLGEAKKIQKCIIIKNILGESIIKRPVYFRGSS